MSAIGTHGRVRVKTAAGTAVIVAGARAPGAGGSIHARANAAVRLTCAPEGVPHVPTADPHDRAHLERSGPMLLPGCDEETGMVRGRPREYPRSAMTSAGVAHDSAFDELYRRQRRLSGVAGIGYQPAPTIADAVAALGPRAFRRLIERDRVGLEAM